TTHTSTDGSESNKSPVVTAPSKISTVPTRTGGLRNTNRTTPTNMTRTTRSGKPGTKPATTATSKPVTSGKTDKPSTPLGGAPVVISARTKAFLESISKSFTLPGSIEKGAPSEFVPASRVGDK